MFLLYIGGAADGHASGTRHAEATSGNRASLAFRAGLLDAPWLLLHPLSWLGGLGVLGN